jgi:histidine ammonia-lyase
MGIHALLIQALNGMVEYYEPFVHEVKPHPGQLWAASQMRKLLKGSKLTSKVGTGKRSTVVGPTESTLRRLLGAVSEKASSSHDEETVQLLDRVLKAIDGKNGDSSVDILEALKRIRANLYENRHLALRYLEPTQDRYSLRCLPQFTGPIRDGLATISRQVETEMNCANDNPLIDLKTDTIYHNGNFLGQYIAVSMDQLRYLIGLLSRHVDSQIALLVEPEFSGGLPPSLVAQSNSPVNSGLKGLQIAGNSISPLISYLGNPIADRFPSHAEQFNQNINSLSFPSAKLARQSIDAYRRYAAIALMFGVQGVDLRSHQLKQAGDYNAESALSPATRGLYHAVRDVVGNPPSSDRAYIWNDDEQALDEHIAAIAEDVALGPEGRIVPCVQDCLRSIEVEPDPAGTRP